MYDLNRLSTYTDKSTFFVLRVNSQERKLEFSPFDTEAEAEAELLRLNPARSYGSPYGVQDAHEMRSTFLLHGRAADAYKAEAKKAAKKNKPAPAQGFGYEVVETDSAQWAIFTR
ncbi:MAG: hypothetical protein JWP57_4250 [Spirosoma sp.]|nr:hypothetical protein [Spirosoma sp.]